MKSVAQTEYAAHPELYSDYVDPSTGITDDNYFYVASLYRLGTAQAAQFQSINQLGVTFHWGSKCYDDSGTRRCDGDVVTGASTNNAYAEMPRSYDRAKNTTLGNYYNYYAATAETGTYSQISGSASDSLCPSGWQLPNYVDWSVTTAQDRNKTWSGMLFDSYYSGINDYPTRAEAAVFARRTPLSVALSGYYLDYAGTIIDVATTARYLTSVAANINARRQYFEIDDTEFASNRKSIGFSIRCVKE